MLLRERGFEATHASEAGLAFADDSEILESARSGGFVVVTLDSDFHTIMALSGAISPSVVRNRIEGLDGPGIEGLLRTVLAACGRELEAGAAVTVTERSIRIRPLPILPIIIEQ